MTLDIYLVLHYINTISNVRRHIMCVKLYEAGKSILEMGYYKNENAKSGDYNPGHEDAVAKVLDNHGFSEVTVPALTRGMLKKWWDNGFDNSLDSVMSDTPAGSYVLQPGGTQSFPDLLVKDFNGRVVALECKSGKGTHPMWNDSTAKHGACYIMSSAKTNSTTLFMGEDVITAEELDVINKYHALFAELKAQCATEMAGVTSKNRGWLYSHRQQFFQQGGGVKTNYFTHVDRNSCEQSALEFLLA